MQIKKGQVYDLEVTEMAYGGKGITKVPTENGNYVVFTPNTIPGQKVKTRIIKKRSKHAEGRVLKLLEKSPLEVDTPYQPVSGAPYASLPLEKQREYKERDSLGQFTKMNCPEVTELYQGMLSSPSDWFYRNKMEYSFSAITWDIGEDDSKDEFGLGFKKRGMWWAVENLRKPSGLFDEAFEKGLSAIKDYCVATGLPPWHSPRNEGFFRTLLVRKSFFQDKFLVALMTSSDGLNEFDFDSFAQFLCTLYPNRIAGVIHTLSDSQGDRYEYDPAASRIIWGEDHLIEDLLGLKFKISLSSFFQTNPASAEKLYTRVIDLVKEYGQEGVTLDMFCGTGTIAQLMARAMPHQQIIGVDITASSIADARKNAELNAIDNVEFHAADVGKYLKEKPELIGKIGTIVLDPPRNGVEGKAMDKVIALKAKTIVYVSCNPATQARDAVRLRGAGYRAQYYCLVDQFPHTSHVEGIAVFQKQ